MAASSDAQTTTGHPQLAAARYHQVEKWFYDYADNIEAVNIHFACTPLGEVPDWNSQRTTRFMPLVEDRLRRKLLKLPVRIADSNHGLLRDRYLLHHYFEIFADGDTHYSQLYTEEVFTDVGNLPAPLDDPSIQLRAAPRDSHRSSTPGVIATTAEAPPPPPAAKRSKAPTTKKKGKR